MSEKNLWDKTNQWAEALELLKSIIAKTELDTAIKWGGEVYTINNKNVVGIGGFKSYVGIWFYNGVFLKDEAKVLVNAQEGLTKALRQWRFQSIDDIAKHENLILQYLSEAIANEKAGLSKKPEKKPAIVSDLFDKEMQSDEKLAKAFLNFTPYKQREFLEYVESAKREETKISRIEKIKPLILENKGLNDKYK